MLYTITKEKQMVKYGVVGTGYFGAELARYMQKNDGAWEKCFL